MNAEYFTEVTTQRNTEQNQATRAMSPGEVRASKYEAHNAIESQMLAAIPWAEENKNRKRRLCEWPECIQLLRATNRLHTSKT